MEPESFTSSLNRSFVSSSTSSSSVCAEDDELRFSFHELASHLDKVLSHLITVDLLQTNPLLWNDLYGYMYRDLSKLKSLFKSNVLKAHQFFALLRQWCFGASGSILQHLKEHHMQSELDPLLHLRFFMKVYTAFMTTSQIMMDLVKMHGIQVCIPAEDAGRRSGRITPNLWDIFMHVFHDSVFKAHSAQLVDSWHNWMCAWRNSATRTMADLDLLCHVIRAFVVLTSLEPVHPAVMNAVLNPYSPVEEPPPPSPLVSVESDDDNDLFNILPGDMKAPHGFEIFVREFPQRKKEKDSEASQQPQQPAPPAAALGAGNTWDLTLLTTGEDALRVDREPVREQDLMQMHHAFEEERDGEQPVINPPAREQQREMLHQRRRLLLLTARARRGRDIHIHPSSRALPLEFYQAGVINSSDDDVPMYQPVAFDDRGSNVRRAVEAVRRYCSRANSLDILAKRLFATEDILSILKFVESGSAVSDADLAFLIGAFGGITKLALFLSAFAVEPPSFVNPEEEQRIKRLLRSMRTIRMSEIFASPFDALVNSIGNRARYLSTQWQAEVDVMASHHADQRNFHEDELRKKKDTTDPKMAEIWRHDVLNRQNEELVALEERYADLVRNLTVSFDKDIVAKEREILEKLAFFRAKRDEILRRLPLTRNALKIDVLFEKKQPVEEEPPAEVDSHMAKFVLKPYFALFKAALSSKCAEWAVIGSHELLAQLERWLEDEKFLLSMMRARNTIGPKSSHDSDIYSELVSNCFGVSNTLAQLDVNYQNAMKNIDHTTIQTLVNCVIRDAIPHLMSFTEEASGVGSGAVDVKAISSILDDFSKAHRMLRQNANRVTSVDSQMQKALETFVARGFEKSVMDVIETAKALDKDPTSFLDAFRVLSERFQIINKAIALKFAGSKDFVSAASRGFTSGIQLDPHFACHAADALALLTTSMASMGNWETEPTKSLISGVLSLLEHVFDKDVFIEQYSKKLSVRLVKGHKDAEATNQASSKNPSSSSSSSVAAKRSNVINLDIEKFVIMELKRSNLGGFQATARLENMLKDVDSSSSISADFNAWMDKMVEHSSDSLRGEKRSELNADADDIDAAISAWHSCPSQATPQDASYAPLSADTELDSQTWPFSSAQHLNHSTPHHGDLAGSAFFDMPTQLDANFEATYIENRYERDWELAHAMQFELYDLPHPDRPSPMRREAPVGFEHGQFGIAPRAERHGRFARWLGFSDRRRAPEETEEERAEHERKRLQQQAYEAKMVQARQKQAEAYVQQATKREPSLRKIDISKPIDINALIVTSSWPQMSSRQKVFAGLRLPSMLAEAWALFTEFYGVRHSGRKLTLLPSLCSVEWTLPRDNLRLSASSSCSSSRLTNIRLQGPLLVFVLIEKLLDGTLTEADLASETGLETEMIRHVLSKTVNPRQKKAIPFKRTSSSSSVQSSGRGTGDAPSASDNISIDWTAFGKNARVVLKLANLSSEEKSAVKASDQQIQAERNHQLDAAIVRVMKAKKNLNFTDLTVAVVEQLSRRFRPAPQTIKLRIEALIEKEYLERGPDDRNLFIYKS